MKSSSSSIVVEWSSSVIRVGQSGQGRPQHVLPWKNDNPRMSEQQFYRKVSPLLMKMWDHLVVAESPNSNSNSNRRVVCVHSPTVPTSWKSALTRALSDLGVSTGNIHFVNGLHTLQYGLGWKRGLVVDISKDEARVVAQVDGASLPETFQAVPCGYDNDHSTFEAATWDTPETIRRWLDESYPLSLMFALLLSLEACPRDVRKDVTSNIIIVGDAFSGLPNFARHVGQRLVSFLDPNTTNDESFHDEESMPLTISELSPKERLSELTTIMTHRTRRSPATKASHVMVTSAVPHRTDVSFWLGSSVWASTIHFQRKRRPNRNMQ